MFLILFQKHLQLLAQHVGKIVRKLAQPFSLPLLSRNLMRRKGLTFRRSRPPTAAAELRALVPSPALCAQPLIPALGPVQKVFKPFWAPALVRQALPAIIFAALRRSRGPALFHGLRPCPSPGAPFWPSGLTLRSSRPAYGGRLTLAVSPITRFMRAPTCSSAPPCSKGFQAFWASSACAASATSYPACSAAPLS